MRYKYDKGTRNHLAAIDWDAIMSSDSINECLEKFENHLMEARKKNVPSCNLSGFKGITKPLWLTGEVTASAESKKKAYTNYRKTGSSDDYDLYKTARNRTKWDLRKAVRSYEKS